MPLFFSFDGIDGTGKTTQIERFRRWLAEQGRDAKFCRDPGSTPLGEQVRRLLLDSDAAMPIEQRSEMLLYMAARAQLVDEVISPALAAGNHVVSDRYLLANIVYQGYVGGLDVEDVRTVGRVAVGGVMPDCTFLLDMDADRTVERMGRELDRIERRGLEYRRRLRDAFLAEASAMGDNVHVIDASGSIDDVATQVCAIAGPLLNAAR